jgi:mannose/fructose/N-acetylgalactosamine-specific phosphotransferase system component IIC
MDFTVLTGIAVALASELMKGMYPMEAAITYSIGIAIPLALLAIEAEVLIRKFHVHWIHFAQKMVLTSHLRTFEWVNILVLFEIFLKGFLAAAVGLAVAHLASSLFFILPAKVIEGLYYGHWLLLALGCSAVIDLLMEKKTVLYLVLSIAAIMILAMLFQNQGAILVSLVLFAGFLVTLFYVGRGEVS